jgi:uncharacterized protein (TIGR02391 family)
MKELIRAFPDEWVLIHLEPEELAGKLLFLLRARVDTAHTFDPVEFQAELKESKWALLGCFNEIKLALAEAYAWLHAQGLILPAPNSEGRQCLSRRARRFENEAAFVDYRTARLLPKDLLHPTIATTVWLSFMRGAYETAAFEAMREVEIAVRRAASYADPAHGMPMMKKAFNPESGPLTDYTVDISEREAMRDLFAGAIGSYKNPHSHRHEPINSPRAAVEIILLANHLLYIVDTRVEAIQAGS